MSRKDTAAANFLRQDPVISSGFFVAIAFLVATAGPIAWFYNKLPPVLPLFYSMVRGQQQLAEKQFILILPILSFVFFLTHLVFAWAHYSHDAVFARIMTISAGLGTFVFAVATWHILLIAL